MRARAYAFLDELQHDSATICLACFLKQCIVLFLLQLDCCVYAWGMDGHRCGSLVHDGYGHRSPAWNLPIDVPGLKEAADADDAMLTADVRNSGKRRRHEQIDNVMGRLRLQSCNRTAAMIASHLAGVTF